MGHVKCGSWGILSWRGCDPYNLTAWPWCVDM